MAEGVRQKTARMYGMREDHLEWGNKIGMLNRRVSSLHLHIITKTA